ncbi:fatty acid desaturase family protein [Sediminibacterium goheungense]|uniref:Linoleoyl-CoA desaturase n=1 Tax=Sediminibacterium goheungense TaxID=1086393 RepID=A0A4R6IZH1_9BACT|nr:acyl-CoA desaturase [Sediminibacterium goheungense]TDO28292.1 linoleoyl-CoA desaturase [Sediminibacterium goheungense]
MSQVTTPKFPAVKQSLHTELKKRVQQYFDERGIAPTGNPKLFTKAIIMVIAFITVYLHLIFMTPVWYLAILECIILGGLVAAIGFNVMHDGSHGSFSHNKWLNRIAASSISMLGANHFMWNMKHNMIHHSFTNVDGVDDDIEVGILMRMAPTQKYYKLHKFQHLYFWVLYMLLYVFWIFFADYRKYFSQKIGNVPLKKMNWNDHVEFWSVKLYHAAVFIVLPIATVGWLYWMIGFIVMSFFAGFVLSIVFQLAHTVEHTEFPVADIETNKLPDEFAAHQIKTTANFATRNKLVSWLVGGLNFQIEHHLFPKISHVHYPAISEIVRNVCREYQLQYIEYPTMRKAVVAHVRFLRQMGREA